MLGHGEDEDGRPQSLAPLLEASDMTQRHRSLRLCVVVCVIMLGTSFQFGFGLSALNSLDTLGPLALSSISGRPLPISLWSLVTAAFAAGGLLGSTFASIVVVALSRRTALYICSAILGIGLVFVFVFVFVLCVTVCVTV